MPNNNCKNQEGYIALITILIISGITLLIAINTSLFGVSESDMGLQNNQSSRAFYLATLCAEDALVKLRNDIDYTGNETLSFEDGDCVILLIEGHGNKDRVVKTTGTVYNQTRKLRIEVNRIDPKLIIGKWREVVNFN